MVLDLWRYPLRRRSALGVVQVSDKNDSRDRQNAQEGGSGAAEKHGRLPNGEIATSSRRMEATFYTCHPSDRDVDMLSSASY